jgi:hypothetical protein
VKNAPRLVFVSRARISSARELRGKWLQANRLMEKVLITGLRVFSPLVNLGSGTHKLPLLH